MIYTAVDEAAPALATFVRDKRHILLITHINPDGDAVGALTALGLALEHMGRRTTLVTPTPTPVFVAKMPAVDRIQDFSADPHLPEDVDLIILVDTGDVARIGRVWTEAQDYVHARPMAIIDHHVTNTGEGIVNLVDPGRSSTCELIYELLRAWDVPITSQIATALMLGIVTDTQSFRTSNTTPSALRTAADLLEYGGDRQRIVQEVYNKVPASTARLMGAALSVMQLDTQLVWTHISQAMQAATGADDDAHAAVTDYLATLGGFRASVLLRERVDGSVKVSFRSLLGVDVSVVAKQFGGGGHRQAAGCTVDGPLAAAEPRVLEALRAHLAQSTNQEEPQREGE